MANTTQQSGTLYNALTAGSKIIGTIVADSDIRIDGRVEGDMQCSGKVVIGEKGSVKGSIACQNAEIMGLLDGPADTCSARVGENRRRREDTDPDSGTQCRIQRDLLNGEKERQQCHKQHKIKQLTLNFHYHEN